jgi:hypothetical protein
MFLYYKQYLYEKCGIKKLLFGWQVYFEEC